MLVSSSELLYDADSTSQIDSSSLSGEAEEPPPPEQPEPPQETPPEQTESPAEAPPQDVPSDDSGIGDLMDIGSSGECSGLIHKVELAEKDRSERLRLLLDQTFTVPKNDHA